MKHNKTITNLFALFALLLVIACGSESKTASETVAEEIPATEVEETKKSVAAGFTSLFNGENLDGWVGDKGSYKIEDGVITVNLEGGEMGGNNLYTEKEYSNFVFRFEFQLTPGANNGLGIHAPLEGDAAYVGKELQILDNTAEKYADLEDYQYHGSVYGLIPAKRGALNPVGEWNEQEVVVTGSKVMVKLNGKMILNGDLEEATKDGTLDGKEHPGLARTSGHIGFLGHGDPLKFRNISIKEL